MRVSHDNLAAQHFTTTDQVPHKFFPALDQFSVRHHTVQELSAGYIEPVDQQRKLVQDSISPTEQELVEILRMPFPET